MAAKKKVAKKKVAKKKTGTKRKTGRRKKTGGQQTYTVTLQSSIPCSGAQQVHRGNPDSVKWKSEDGKYTLTFGFGWPFDASTPPDAGTIGSATNPPQIVVPAGGNSRKFNIASATAKRKYAYDIQPPACPHPDEPGKKPNPVVDVDD